MIATSEELAAVAQAILAQNHKVSEAEGRLFSVKPAPPSLVKRIKAEIRNGNDPLGNAYCTIHSRAERRKNGATYTPKLIVDAMIAWAMDERRDPERIVDAGAGSGRFTVAAAMAFPKAKLVAVEIDPLAALTLRANAAVLGFANRLSVEIVDYRDLALPKIAGPTLFIGNPPYVRHHNIEKLRKAWFASTAKSFGFAASGLAGLHIHFFLKTHELARDGDIGAFITSSEWLDVNYGSLLRKLLADGLGGTALHVLDPKVQPFSDAMTTGAITCFRVGQRPDRLTLRAVDKLDELAPLSEGREVDWAELEPAPKWSILIRESPKPETGHIELGSLFRVHRGQVSGNNAVWIESGAAKGIPSRFLFPTITRARDLIEAGQELSDYSRLRRVIDLPRDLSELRTNERGAIDRFLSWAKLNGGDTGWIATHRRAWWSVGLRAPAPILCTYMARRAPAFVRNSASARHLNIAHGLYPVEPLSEVVMNAILRYLRANTTTSGGRTYAGGLVKFEPREVERMQIPHPSAIVSMFQI